MLSTDKKFPHMLKYLLSHSHNRYIPKHELQTQTDEIYPLTGTVSGGFRVDVFRIHHIVRELRIYRGFRVTVQEKFQDPGIIFDNLI